MWPCMLRAMHVMARKRLAFSWFLFSTGLKRWFSFSLHIYSTCKIITMEEIYFLRKRTLSNIYLRLIILCTWAPTTDYMVLIAL